MLESLWSDLRYATRSLRRSPGLTAAAIVTIGLGIGINAGIFTVLNGVLLRDVPAPDAHELVSIAQAVEGVRDLHAGQETFTTSEYRAYRDRTSTLSGLLAIGTARGETTLGGDAPQKVYGALVSCNYFSVLQQTPALGRPLSARDCEPAAEPVVVLGHELWKAAFAADPTLVGRTIELNRRRFAVVGVAAEGTYAGPIRIGYFAPFNAGHLLSPSDPRYEDDEFPWLTLIGRRSDGTSLDHVRAELGVIAAQIDQQQPGRSTRLTVERAKAMGLPPGSRGSATGAAAVLMAAFGCVLLIACANVANLLLARGTSRRQEMGLRVALGASRGRLVRQLLAESLLISLAGGLLGCMLAVWSFGTLVGIAVPALVPPGLPVSFAWNLSPDARVAAFAAALTFGTGLLFGLAPALHVSKPDLHAVIKQDSPGTGISRRGGLLRGTLVGAQVASCMVLMIATGLLLRGLYTTYTVDPGFEYENVSYLVLESMFEGHDPEDAARLRERLTSGIAALPGVDAVARTDREPLGDDVSTIVIRLPGQGEGDGRVAQLNQVTPDYFSLLGLPIVRGRTFTQAEMGDRDAGTHPAIITEATARNLWPGADPLGRTLLSDVGTLQVVGVTADAQVTAIAHIDPYYVYLPGGGGAVLVRSRASFGTTASGIRATARALDPAIVATVLPLESTLGYWRGLSGLVTALGAALGALALLLASIGIYGVVSYAVTSRYREIGIRMALGATARAVLGMMLRETMRPVVAGAAIGFAAAAAASGVLSGVLFGVSPADPLGIGGAALLVIAVALAAGIIAARPATRIDPNVTLRYE